MGDFDPRGVNERLVRKVRRPRRGRLRARPHRRVRRFVDKIDAFERHQVPVDAYGVGSFLIRGENDFTADIVMADGRPTAKVESHIPPNERLELVR